MNEDQPTPVEVTEEEEQAWQVMTDRLDEIKAQLISTLQLD